ncbi:MAG: GrpB family protein [Caulobacterales bacterium]|jgi:GrpB-like predicted nucleotidyltransferase (UPF0157 family)
MADDIELVDYDPNWPSQFAAEAAFLRAALGQDLIAAIDHFGSTAVPGLAAKPIIDILLTTTDLAGARARFPDVLKTHGYVFWRDDPNPERLYLVKGLAPFGPKRTHHLHVVPAQSPMRAQISFARHLAANPDIARAYGALKAELAERYRTDREAYTEGKTAFISAIMAQIKTD